MDSFTKRELLQLAPQAIGEYLDALVDGWGEIQRHGIDTPLKLCEFLAQAAHETGGFTILEENLNYSAARLCQVWPTRFRNKYDPKAIRCANNPERLAEVVYGGRLGNRDPGDGYRYRGRGFLQDTGRATYAEYGRIIGADLERLPDLLAKPPISLRVALARWRKMGLNRFAERHYTRAIGNAINRGNPYSTLEPIGHDSRLDWFNRAWMLFGEGPVPLIPGLALGAYGAQVEVLQNRLRELGYFLGAADGVFGPLTARAVVAFKAEHKRRTNEDLDPEEIVDTRTLTALNGAPRAEISEERTTVTVRDLIAAGSQEAAGGQQQQAVGTTVTAIGLAAGSQKAVESAPGLLDQAQQVLGYLPSWVGVLSPCVDAVRWALANWLWAILLIAGVVIWSGGYRIVQARLTAHRTGANLAR
jgi:putative chitinase